MKFSSGHKRKMQDDNIDNNQHQQSADESYSIALAAVKTASLHKDSEPEFLARAREMLVNAKTTIRALRTTKQPKQSQQHPSYRCYPPPTDIPKDEEDARYAVSFDAMTPEGAEQGLLFFKEWGFVVFRDVITAQACAATKAEIHASLEARTPGLNLDDATTHHLLAIKPTRCGLPDEQAVFTPQIVRNRQSPALYTALAAVMELPRAETAMATEPGFDSILMSADR
jgi:hypothetical protein